MRIASGTNRRNIGRISAARRTKSTRMLTIPCSLFKSSTKDSSLSTFEIVLQHNLTYHNYGQASALQSYDAGPGGLSLFILHRKR